MKMRFGKAEKKEKGNVDGTPASPSAGEKGGLFAAKVRGMVSMNKVRFQEEGFDLDLTYITPRMIAMGFPSYGTEGYYRNPVDQVEMFFNTKHEGHYRVYNLCSERKYDKDTRFHGCFKRFPFDDHNAPAPISIIPAFVDDVKDFLAEHPKNVVAVHCKAGKGRTGVLITAFLMAMEPEYRMPKTALERFAALRTNDGKGVTIPSQHRYVGYWDKMLQNNNGAAPPSPPLKIESISIKGGAQWDLYVTVAQGPERMGAEATVVYDTKQHFGSRGAASGGGTYSFDLRSYNVVVRGDVKVIFKAAHRMRKDDHLFHFWFHTAFTQQGDHTFPKSKLDKAAKDEKHATFKADLMCTMTVGEAPEECRLRGESKFFEPGVQGVVPEGEGEAQSVEGGEDEDEVMRAGSTGSPFPSPVVDCTEEEQLEVQEDEEEAPGFPVSIPTESTVQEEAKPEESETIEEAVPELSPARCEPQPTESEPPDAQPAETDAERRLRELRQKREQRQRERAAEKERRERDRKEAEEKRQAEAVAREAQLQAEAEHRRREREERRRRREDERQQEEQQRENQLEEQEKRVKQKNVEVEQPDNDQQAEQEEPQESLGQPEELIQQPEKEQPTASYDHETPMHPAEVAVDCTAEISVKEHTAQDQQQRAREKIKELQQARGQREREKEDLGAPVIAAPTAASPTPAWAEPPHRIDGKALEGRSEVVDLAMGIIRRVKALEATCSAAVSKRAQVEADASRVQTSPSDTASLPLPLLALSLLQRSSRLEIMCLQERDYRRLRSEFKRL